MPVKRKTKQDRIREAFARMYKVGKANSDLNDSDVADLLGVSVMTLRAKRNNPQELKLGQLAVLATAFQWGAEEVTNLVGIMQ